MNTIQEYLFQVTSAAIICGIVTGITAKKGSGASIIRLMTVVFMIITIMTPVVSVKMDHISGYFSQIETDSDAFVTAGSEASRDKITLVIKEKTQAYILDKASLLGADISVEVTLSDDALPFPIGVRLCGAVSPYAKNRLSKIIQDDFGIPLEEQKWES